MKRARKSRVFLITAVALIGFAYGGWRWYESFKEPKTEYITAEARKGDLRSTILATGKVQPLSLVSVGTQTSGMLQELYVDYNSVVKKGQLIAVIDPKIQRANLASANAALASAQAELLETRANLALANQNFERSRRLYSGELIARSEFENSETSAKTAAARLRVAEARVAQQRASVEKAQFDLEYTKIYSPVDGVVVKRAVDVGQTVAASYNTPTIAEIAEDLSRMKVEVNIDEADIGSVRTGQRAEFTVDAFADRKFEGEVSQVRMSPAAENNVISYTVIVSFVNHQIEGRNLIPGMTANVTLIVDEKNDVVMIPNSALRFRPVQSDGRAGAGSQPGGPPPGGGRRSGSSESGERAAGQRGNNNIMRLSLLRKTWLTSWFA
ncbi:RND transporter [Synergistales bacterium]|nr:RND transporter [Synergistales bacterium]